MQSALDRTMGVTPFAVHSTPSVTMMVYAVGYLLVALFAAIYRFNERDL
jgi:hypothetical protein